MIDRRSQLIASGLLKPGPRSWRVRVDGSDQRVLSRVWRMAGFPRPHLKSWVGILRKDPCSWCGKRDRKRMTIDHVTPRSKGGSRGHTPSNSAAACPRCNGDRRNMTVLEFLFARRFGVVPQLEQMSDPEPEPEPRVEIVEQRRRPRRIPVEEKRRMHAAKLRWLW